ncbi:MAG: ADP-ribosylglycohydrolase family protein [Bacteriovoracaceae bacterium]|nr:ADP-ribosylglycohydrolase family protein [Bacteriovoracaceae bacterium]
MEFISRIDIKKAEGMLIGAHCGEALGATLEFDPVARERESWLVEIEGGGPFNWRPGDATDDMDMMMCLLRSLSQSEKFDYLDVSKRFVDWYETEPPDVGGTIGPALAKMSEGVEPLNCSRKVEHLQGNGSLMRCAPLSLFLENQELIEASRVQCLLTHGSETCQHADEIFLFALQDCFNSVSKDDIYTNALNRSSLLNIEIYNYLKQIPNIEWDDLKCSGWTIHTLGAALWSLISTDNYEQAVLHVINRGDDSDTCGCVTGALAGAYYGVDAIPDKWQSVIEFGDEIRSNINRTKHA